MLYCVKKIERKSERDFGIRRKRFQSHNLIYLEYTFPVPRIENLLAYVIIKKIKSVLNEILILMCAAGYIKSSTF